MTNVWIWLKKTQNAVLNVTERSNTDKVLIYGDVKVSTGVLTLGKRVAVRNRFKIRNLKITDNNKVALAA